MYSRRIVYVTTAGVAIGASIVIFIAYYQGLIDWKWWIVIGTTLLLISIGALIFGYLQDRTAEFMLEDRWDTEYHKKISKYRSLANDVSVMSFLDDIDKNEILTTIKRNYKDTILDELLADREEDSSPVTTDEMRLNQINDAYEVLDSLTGRISGEISSLSTRANVNLVIGCVTTFLSIGILIMFTQSLPRSFENSLELASYYIPRLSVVVFVEVFAFFFLRLYQSNLDEIKYYRNEATNIDFRHTALRTAMINNDTENTKLIISEFLKVERNSILQRGETTVEIETSKYQHRYDKSFVDSLKGVLESLQKWRLFGKE